MIERTLLLVKPDGVYRALIGKVISKLEDKGLKVIGIKLVTPNKELAGMHYTDDKEWMESVGTKTLASYKEKGVNSKESALQIGKRVRDYLISSISGGPVVAVAIEGNEAIFITRKLVGSTEPRNAEPSTIRGKYSSDSYDLADKLKRPIKNIVHASEDKKTAERELAVWFNKKELLNYKRADESSLY